MTLDITKRDYYLELKKRRDKILNEYDSILYPHMNVENEAVVYFHVKDLTDTAVWNMNAHLPHREPSECVLVYDNKVHLEVVYLDKEEYEFEIGNNKEGAKQFTGRVVCGKWLSKNLMSTVSEDIDWDAPPLYLCKGNKIIGTAKNVYLDKEFNDFDFNICMTEVLEYNYDYMYENFIKLKIGSSVRTRLNSMDIEVDKVVLENSPLLDKGVMINDEGSLLCIWKSDDNLFFSIRGKKEKRLPTLFSISFEELPKVISYPSLLEIMVNRFNHLMDSEEGTVDFPNKHEKFWMEKDVLYPQSEHTLLTCLSFNDYLCEMKKDEGDINKVIPLYDTVLDEVLRVLKYALCLNITGLKKYIKGGKGGNIEFNQSNIEKYASRTWSWGDNKVRYVYPPKKSSNRKVSHYVRPHLCRTRIKKTWNYQDYTIHEDELGYFVIKYRSGCWKGMDNILFFLGKDSTGGYSKKAISWLRRLEKEGHNIQHAENGGEIRVELGDGKYYLLDGYDKETNTVYEFHGNVYHGNPRLFDDDEKCHPFNNKTAKELYDATIVREDNLRKMGYNLIVMWEDEYDRMVRA